MAFDHIRGEAIHNIVVEVYDPKGYDKGAKPFTSEVRLMSGPQVSQSKQARKKPKGIGMNKAVREPTVHCLCALIHFQPSKLLTIGHGHATASLEAIRDLGLVSETDSFGASVFGQRAGSSGTPGSTARCSGQAVGDVLQQLPDEVGKILPPAVKAQSGTGGLD
ncbi:hypothetical protein DUI87_08422 [Hirundo rustica rustica]|uniref:Uncharacterized protein n=1 Tax=Hirundo rustica rustica TaxID=333673 RepID=A0A3M0KSE2_HIRRU|nr:hypothetical protein DUI87_08422 [Hirundo rustica rustica]